MKRFEFDNLEHHANMWVIHQGKKYYVISVCFPEALFGLVPQKEDYPADEWSWVRCESVELIKNEVIIFPRKQILETLK